MDAKKATVNLNMDSVRPTAAAPFRSQACSWNIFSSYMAPFLSKAAQVSATSTQDDHMSAIHHCLQNRSENLPPDVCKLAIGDPSAYTARIL